MARLWAILFVLALTASVWAQGSTTNPPAGSGSGTGGGQTAPGEGLDLSFGSDQKNDGWVTDPENPINNPEPEPEDPSGETPPDPPELYGEEFPVETAAIVFIIDCSCSMDSQWQSYIGVNGEPTAGYRMDRAKAEVATAIGQLSENFKFDVVMFICGQSACFSQLKKADADNKATALAWVGGLYAQDATGTGPAVAWALTNGAYSECKSYILLTDGSPNCTDSGYGWADWPTHLTMINSANTKGATIHVVAIAPTYIDMQTFCQQVASQNGPGTYKVVN